MTTERDRSATEKASPQFEVTPKMIEAGVYELRTKSFGENLESVVEAVFWAMISELSLNERFSPDQDIVQVAQGQCCDR